MSEVHAISMSLTRSGRGFGSLIISLVLASDIAQVSAEVYCSDEVYKPQCPPGQIIVPVSAFYGRRDRKSRCLPATDPLHALDGCGGDVTSYVASLCLGRQRCQVPVTSLEGQVTEPTIHTGPVYHKPCPSSVRQYLTVEHTCEQGIATTCQEHSDPVHGVVTSVQMNRGEMFSQSCPWKINLQPGHFINITFRDFTEGGIGSKITSGGSGCPVTLLVTMSSGDTPRRLSMCNTGPAVGKPRTVWTYPVKTPFEADVSLQTNHIPMEQALFVIAYSVTERKVCPTYAPPHGYLYKQTSPDTVTVSCDRAIHPDAVKTTWILRCVDGDWRGPMSQCTAPMTRKPNPPAGSTEATVNVQKEIHYTCSTKQIALYAVVGFLAGLVVMAIPMLVYCCSLRRKKSGSDEGALPMSGNPTQGHDNPTYEDIPNIPSQGAHGVNLPAAIDMYPTKDDPPPGYDL